MNSLKELNAADDVTKGYSLTKFDKIAAVVFPVLSLLVTLYAQNSSSAIWNLTKTLLDLRK
jgi:hypothetical protein